MATTPVRFGVLGTGHWARTCHGAALAAHPDVELVGFWGRDPEKADHAAAGAGAARGFADLDELLERVDAVTLAVPPDVQPDLAVRAARAGKHLLLDKPLALDLASADAVVQECARTGVASVSYLTYLFQPDITDWLQHMASLAEQHGPWEGVSARWAGTIDVPGNPYGASAWRRERGGLWDTGPHALSILDELLPPVRRVGGARGIRDAAHLVLQHEGGAASSVTLTVTAPEGTGGSALNLWGPGGRHDLPRFHGTPQEGFQRAVDALRRSASTGDPHPLDVQHARRTVAVLVAAEKHLRTSGASTAVRGTAVR